MRSPLFKTLTQASLLTSHPKPTGIIEKRLPAPTPQGAGGAEREGGRNAGVGNGGFDGRDKYVVKASRVCAW